MTHVHFIGIGGTGLSAIARVLIERGYTVTGSDQSLSSFAKDLREAGAKVHVGHDPHNVAGADWVVRSSAIQDENPEVQAAARAGIPVYKRADILGMVMSGKSGIAVAGTHGKTTTTSMIAWLLSALHQDPSFIIGSAALNFGVNARAGKGKYFVIEADEYDRMFLGLRPEVEVVTNLEHDHPDCFPTFDLMRSAFEAFVDLLPAEGTLVACSEDAGARGLLQHAEASGKTVVRYERSHGAKNVSTGWVLADAITPNQSGGFTFNALAGFPGARSEPVELRVPGEHNVLNALAALAVVGQLELPFDEACQALARFEGTSRRFEVRGVINGVTVVDDYAHHPTEIRAALAAARARFGRRIIWAVWQPHTYSRTRAFLAGFASAFIDADHLLVTDIYASREPTEAFTSEDVVRDMRHPDVHYSGSLEETVQQLSPRLRPGNVLLVLSAGDAIEISDRILTGA